jgi:hypothetical protein
MQGRWSTLKSVPLEIDPFQAMKLKPLALDTRLRQPVLETGNSASENCEFAPG